MNLQNLKIALWIVAVALMAWIAVSVHAFGRYQMTYFMNRLDGFDVIARIDTKTGEIESFVLDPKDYKFKKSLD